MPPIPMIQFGFDKEGKLQLCVPPEVWSALKEVALSKMDLEVSEGYVRVPLHQIADFKIQSISIVADSEMPPCTEEG